MAIGGFVACRRCGQPLDYPRRSLRGGRQTAGCSAFRATMWLAQPEVASVVVRILRKGATEGRYDLGSWVLMPNHVHVLLNLGRTLDNFTRVPGGSLSQQIAWIKGRTAFEANRVMKRSGSFWAKDYFDHWIRDRNELEKVVRYVERNPVKAGLCKSPEEWEWSSVRDRRD